MMRWGTPNPPSATHGPYSTIRNTASTHWRRWLGPENRCLVPFTSFSDARQNPTPRLARKTSAGSRSTTAGRYSPVRGTWTEYAGDRRPKSPPEEIFSKKTSHCRMINGPVRRGFDFEASKFAVGSTTVRSFHIAHYASDTLHHGSACQTLRSGWHSHCESNLSTFMICSAMK